MCGLKKKKNLLRFVFGDFECVGFFQAENVSNKMTFCEFPKTHLIQPYLGAKSCPWKSSCSSVLHTVGRGEHSWVLSSSHRSRIPDSGITHFAVSISTKSVCP